MAVKNKIPKPLFGLKHDFVASLDHTLRMTINLLQAVDTAIKLGDMKEPVRASLVAANTALRSALLTDE